MAEAGSNDGYRYSALTSDEQIPAGSGQIMGLKQSEYVLGHTNAEQLRLIRQARVLAPFTDRLFRDAGIASGMRVLDVGCGMGDVTMLAAQLVGPTGRVVSIDRDQASIETARRRVSAIGLENVRFINQTF
jgi:ubiquinone/menaquinone biosynthesis C-methylase UbiE